MTAAELNSVPASNSSAVMCDILARDGAVIISGLLSPAVVKTIEADLAAFVDAREPGFNGSFDTSFYGPNTKRIQGLAAKSPTFVTDYLLHPALLALADGILLPSCGNYWMSQAETIYIGPGEEPQDLHRDDENWEIAARLKIDLQISVLLAVGDYAKEVGATQVAPGSHRWDLERHADPSEVITVELEAGDALVYLGSTLHGGGTNSTPDRWRRAIYCSYLVGWLTPEEAVALSLTPEIVATLPQRARELLGWSSVQGIPATTEGAAALQLWQLDHDDRERLGGLFTHR
ncbi:MAG: phytanoyl-CoA dioxygenase family protein [Actinomycetes bacterium]